MKWPKNVRCQTAIMNTAVLRSPPLSEVDRSIACKLNIYNSFLATTVAAIKGAKATASSIGSVCVTPTQCSLATAQSVVVCVTPTQCSLATATPRSVVVCVTSTQC